MTMALLYVWYSIVHWRCSAVSNAAPWLKVLQFLFHVGNLAP
jgi:hypothetical protein